MRRLLGSIVLFTLALAPSLATATTAAGSPVLTFEDGRVTRSDDPALPPSGPADPTSPEARSEAAEILRSAAPRHRAPVAGETVTASPAGTRRARVRVRNELRSALRRGTLSAAQRNRFASDFDRALGAHRRLSGHRRAELGRIVSLVERLAGRGALRANRGRMNAVFLTLRRNREWWAARGAPAAGARVDFGRSPLIFQYYPSQGLQIQPLANFGRANGYWMQEDERKLERLVDDLVPLAARRGGHLAWEYYFDFLGGSPPWTSAMSQGTAIQALARASDMLGDRAYAKVARRAVGIFGVPTPRGVKVRARRGSWYTLYSFQPKVKVLNGFLQSLVGLWDYRSITDDRRAAKYFSRGDAVARSTIGAFDTGAWSLYSIPGSEASLNYHDLQTQFLGRLCDRARSRAYCDYERRFKRYRRLPPTLEGASFSRRKPKRGRTAFVRFRLSKISTVTLRVKQISGGRTYWRQAALGRGGRRIYWDVPSAAPKGRYLWSLSARDLAGNATDRSPSGTITVR